MTSYTHGLKQHQKRAVSLALEVYKTFKEQIVGNHKPHQYKTEAADDIAKFIKDSVSTALRGTTRDMRTYFNVMSTAAVDTGDLYESP